MDKAISYQVGLAGLTPSEVVKGVLLCKDFQHMPDPLDSDLFGDVVTKVEVSTH